MTSNYDEYDRFEANLEKFQERTMEIIHEDCTERESGSFVINGSIRNGVSFSSDETDKAMIGVTERIAKEARKLQVLGSLVTLASGAIELTRTSHQQTGQIETAITDHPVTGSLDGVVFRAGVPKYRLSLPNISIDTHWLKASITPKATSAVSLGGLAMPQFQHNRSAAHLPFQGRWEFNAQTVTMDANGTTFSGNAWPQYKGESVIGDTYPDSYAESPWKTQAISHQ